MTEHKTKVLVLGSGAAGCTAAIYAARANLRPIMVAGLQPGGQLTITTSVENYPGFADPIIGPELMEHMQKQAENVGTRLIHDTIVDVDLSQRPFICTGDSGDTYAAGALIIATGASARWLGLESERKYSGMGVSACATCDGFFFRGKPVVVVGGGNTAAEEALYLANLCSSVTLVHRRGELRAEKIMQGRLFAHEKIACIWNSVIDDVLGGGQPEAVTGVRLKNVNTGETRTLNCEGVFIAIGHRPNSGLFAGTLDMDESGYLLTRPGSTKTNVAGVFAAGDVQDHVFRQAVTAAGSGCMAAIEADRFLSEQGGTAPAPGTCRESPGSPERPPAG